MSDALRRTLERRLGWRVDALRPVGGGDLSDAYRVDTADGPRFVKTSADAAPGSFRAEAAGLLWLTGAPGGVAVPRVVGVHDPGGGDRSAADADGEPRLLALQWVQTQPLSDRGAERLGRALAATHAAGAPAFGATPRLAGSPSAEGGGGSLELGGDDFHDPCRFGTVALPNEPTEDFPAFLGERRIGPLVALACERGAFDGADVQLFDEVIARLPERCGPPEPPARTHGDLWTGNVLGGAGDAGWVIDPAAHGSHREVDLAALQLFGSPPPAFLAAYEEAFPLADGAADRVELMQLPILLLHVVLFGGGYTQAARRIAHHYR